tara:strand:- start:864 stop:1112 length:249 start_codon:yes stop_codon:yes gene_type:complete
MNYKTISAIISDTVFNTDSENSVYIKRGKPVMWSTYTEYAQEWLSETSHGLSHEEVNSVLYILDNIEKPEDLTTEDLERILA